MSSSNTSINIFTVASLLFIGAMIAGHWTLAYIFFVTALLAIGLLVESIQHQSLTNKVDPDPPKGPREVINVHDCANSKAYFREKDGKIYYKGIPKDVGNNYYYDGEHSYYWHK